MAFEAYLEDVALSEQLLPGPPSQQAKLGSHAADCSQENESVIASRSTKQGVQLTLSRPPPHDCWRSREADELVELDQGALEGALDEGLVLLGERHLKRDERGAEGGQGPDDAQNVVLLKPEPER